MIKTVPSILKKTASELLFFLVMALFYTPYLLNAMNPAIMEYRKKEAEIPPLSLVSAFIHFISFSSSRLR